MPSIRELLGHRKHRDSRQEPRTDTISPEYNLLSGEQRGVIETHCEELMQKPDFTVNDFNEFVVGLGELLGGTQSGVKGDYIVKNSNSLIDYENKADIFIQISEMFGGNTIALKRGTVFVRHDNLFHSLSPTGNGSALRHSVRIRGLNRVPFENYVTNSTDEVTQGIDISQDRQLSPQEAKPFASRLLELYRKDVADIQRQ